MYAHYYLTMYKFWNVLFCRYLQWKIRIPWTELKNMVARAYPVTLINKRTLNEGVECLHVTRRVATRRRAVRIMPKA